jgi:hypothetical protein
MQWIPGHSNTLGNNKLAKKGSREEQQYTPTTLYTVKQLLKTVNKEDWLNRLAMGSTGREVYKYMARLNSKDSINTLKRRDQSTICRLRAQHIQLNSHPNIIQP